MTEALWDPAVDDDKKRDVLESFAALCHLDDLVSVKQLGRDHRTARFTLCFASGRDVHVGTIDTFTSRAKLENVLMVACGAWVEEMKPAQFRKMIAAVIHHATDVEEAQDQLLAERVVDWLDEYTRSVAKSADDAVARRLPYKDAGKLYIHAESFGRWLRREYSEAIPSSDIRAALRDLGFTVTKVSYNASGSGASRKRTSASYYRGTLPEAADA